MNRFVFTVLILFLLTHTAEAQEQLHVNYTYMVTSSPHNIITEVSPSKTLGLSVIWADKLFQQPVFVEVRYDYLHFFDTFGYEYDVDYLSLGVGPRFSFFKYFTYDVGFYVGLLIDSKTNMFGSGSPKLPERPLTGAKIMATQRLSYGINIFSNVNFNIYGEMHHHFIPLVAEDIFLWEGEAGYDFTYNVGIGFSYQFGK